MLKTQFNLYISWFDFRLKIFNMKTNFNFNTLTKEEKNSIWVPILVFRIVPFVRLIKRINNVFFSNTEEKDTTLNDDKSFTVAERTSDFEYSDESIKDNIYVFKGSENPFVMSRVYDVNWICEYDMSWYPFDTQTCYMKFQPDGNSGEFIDLVDDGLEYLGPRDLTQYFIRSTKMIRDMDIGSINVMVVLGRRLLGLL